MPKWLIFTLLFGLMVIPSAAGAQGGTKLESINIELWSEYDQPSMLVINEFVVSPNTPLPAEVTIRFPKEGNLIAVAMESNGDLFNSEFEGPVEQGNWQTITLNVQTYDPHRIEYYQTLTREENMRHFKFKWFGDYYVQQFNLNMLIPGDSTHLITTPPLSNTQSSANNLYLTGSISRRDMKMGNSFEFDLSYERTSDVLTAADQPNQVQPSEPVGPDTPGRVSVDRLPWVIGGMGLALIAIALWIYWRSMQSNEDPSAGSASRRRRSPRTQEDADGQIHCHECGARAQPGDRFCRTCGSKLRAE
ncbi:MAG TPA: zinc ribbon domain-containing protein [Anaerolineales bacterium]|nr:zinc ribbon domain-containing protein [Anaerolineales bacterium]